MASREPMDSNDPNIGKNVRAIRQAMGVSQAEVAKRAKMKQPALSQLETGELEWKAHQISAVADALGVTAADLYSDAPVPSEKEIVDAILWFRANLTFDELKDLVNVKARLDATGITMDRLFQVPKYQQALRVFLRSLLESPE